MSFNLLLDHPCQCVSHTNSATKPFILQDVFFGPVDMYTLAPVNRLASYWNIPVLSNGGQEIGFRNKTQREGVMLTVLGGTYNQSANFLEKVLNHFKW